MPWKRKRRPTAQELIEAAALKRGQPQRQAPVPKRKKVKAVRRKDKPPKPIETSEPMVSKRTWLRKKRKK